MFSTACRSTSSDAPAGLQADVADGAAPFWVVRAQWQVLPGTPHRVLRFEEWQPVAPPLVVSEEEEWKPVAPPIVVSEEEWQPVAPPLVVSEEE